MGRSPLQRSWYAGKKTVAQASILVQRAKSIGKNHIRPMYAGANMGHPSRTIDRGLEAESASSLLCTQVYGLEALNLVSFLAMALPGLIGGKMKPG
jgi:hypothetical protein